MGWFQSFSNVITPDEALAQRNARQLQNQADALRTNGVDIVKAARYNAQLTDLNTTRSLFALQQNTDQYLQDLGSSTVSQVAKLTAMSAYNNIGLGSRSALALQSSAVSEALLNARRTLATAGNTRIQMAQNNLIDKQKLAYETSLKIGGIENQARGLEYQGASLLFEAMANRGRSSGLDLGMGPGERNKLIGDALGGSGFGEFDNGK